MTDSNITMHPILDSVVHRSFRAASKDAGCCEFTEANFDRSIKPYTSTLTDALGVHELDAHRLWTSMMAGEVIAVEFDGGTMLFHVQGRAFGHYIDMRFLYQTDRWSIQAITSVHTRPLWTSRIVRMATAAVLGMVITGFIGYAMAAQRAPVSRQTVESWASLHGYTLVQNQSMTATAVGSDSSSGSDNQAANTGNSVDNSQAASDAQASNASSAGGSGDNATSTNTAGNSSAANTATAKSSTSNTDNTAARPAAPQSFQFVFRSGMTVHDISAFLQQHQLVKDAYAFDQVLHKTGVEKKIWPGTYTFKSNMNQSQILQELQSHPSH